MRGVARPHSPSSASILLGQELPTFSRETTRPVETLSNFDTTGHKKAVSTGSKSRVFEVRSWHHVCVVRETISMDRIRGKGVRK